MSSQVIQQCSKKNVPTENKIGSNQMALRQGKMTRLTHPTQEGRTSLQGNRYYWMESKNPCVAHSTFQQENTSSNC